jgi:steroid 5-alpha reductase family enzyme
VAVDLGALALALLLAWAARLAARRARNGPLDSVWSAPLAVAVAVVVAAPQQVMRPERQA